MSLVNEMLIDLQRRREPGGKTLAGLRPVALPSVRLPIATLAPVLVVLTIGPWGAMSGGGPAASLTVPVPEPGALAGPLVETVDGILADIEPKRPGPDAAEPDSPAEPPAPVPSTLASIPASPEPAERDDDERYADEHTAPGADTLAAALTIAAPLTTAAPTASGSLIKQATTNAATLAEAALHDGFQSLRVASFFQAERQFREAVALQPDHSEAWSYLYTALLRQDRAAAAEDVALEGLEQALDPAPLAKLYASTLAERGELGPALDVLQAHRPGGGVDVQYDEFLASLLRAAERHADAAQVYQGLLAGDASQGDWWMGLAISQDAAGNTPDARAAFERARQSSGISATLADYATHRIEALRLQN